MEGKEEGSEIKGTGGAPETARGRGGNGEVGGGIKTVMKGIDEEEEGEGDDAAEEDENEEEAEDD